MPSWWMLSRGSETKRRKAASPGCPVRGWFTVTAAIGASPGPAACWQTCCGSCFGSPIFASAADAVAVWRLVVLPCGRCPARGRLPGADSDEYRATLCFDRRPARPRMDLAAPRFLPNRLAPVLGGHVDLRG